MAQVGTLCRIADSDFLLGLPIAHVEGVGDDPRAWLQILQQFGTKLEVDARQQE